MKAVELEVSVIGDCLSDAMAPREAVDEDLLKKCNNAAAIREASVKSPSKPCNGFLYTPVSSSGRTDCVQNGINENGKIKDNCSQNGIEKDFSTSHTIFRVKNVTKENCCGTGSVRTSLDVPLNTSVVNGVQQESAEVKQEHVVDTGYHNGEVEKLSLGSLTFEKGRDRSPPKDIPQLQADSGLESAASSWDQAESRLRDELQHAREQLKLKDDEVLRLTRVRAEVEAELQELTASLFLVMDSIYFSHVNCNHQEQKFIILI